MSFQASNFIVLFQGRTASTFLMDALDRHPAITARGEKLARFKQADVEDLTHGLASLAKRPFRRRPDVAQIDLTRGFFTKEPRTTPLLGFKTKVGDVLDLVGMKVLLEDLGVRAVIMERRNLVKQAISHMNAARLYERTKHERGPTAWNLYSEKDRMGALCADPDEFDRMLRRVVFDEAILQAFSDFLDVPKLRVEYADLLRGPLTWFASIYAFLGVSEPATESAVLKNTSDDLRSAVANFDELRSRYVGTRFELMFDEVIA